MIQWLLLTTEFILLCILWTTLASITTDPTLSIYYTRYLAGHPPAQLLPTLQILLGIWCTLIALFWIPPLYRFLRRRTSSRASSNDRFGMWVYVLSVWTKMVVMALVAWFTLLNGQQVARVIAEVSYQPQAAEVRFLERLAERLATVFTLSCVCLGVGWVQQNIAFYHLGSLHD